MSKPFYDALWRCRCVERPDLLAEQADFDFETFPVGSMFDGESVLGWKLWEGWDDAFSSAFCDPSDGLAPT